jgi:hypothetical protein
LRLFEEMTGEPSTGSLGFRANELMNRDVKKFKRTENIQEAAELLPKIIEDMKQRYGDKPELLMSKIKGLKQNSYQTMPNPEIRPQKFVEYYNYLVNVLGEKEAQEKLQNYLKQNAINKAKSSAL